MESKGVKFVVTRTYLGLGHSSAGDRRTEYEIVELHGQYFVRTATHPQTNLGEFLRWDGDGMYVRKLLNQLQISNLDPLSGTEIRVLYNYQEAAPRHWLVVSGGKLNGSKVPQ